jgi:hypothetical protein
MMLVPEITGGFGPFVRPLFEQIDWEIGAGYGAGRSAQTLASKVNLPLPPVYGAPAST